MRYKFVEEDVTHGYILDELEDRIVALVETKRPDLRFETLHQLVEKANLYELKDADLVSGVNWLVILELASAEKKFPKMCTAHHGYAVILEEFDEFMEEIAKLKLELEVVWKNVKRNENEDAKEAAKYLMDRSRKACAELIQVAAMAQRFRNDIET